MTKRTEATQADKTTADVLAEQGTSQCIEYRRAWRRAYRRGTRRIDYYPGRAAAAVLDAAVESGAALSMHDALDQALEAWGERLE